MSEHVTVHDVLPKHVDKPRKQAAIPFFPWNQIILPSIYIRTLTWLQDVMVHAYNVDVVKVWPSCKKTLTALSYSNKDNSNKHKKGS